MKHFFWNYIAFYLIVLNLYCYFSQIDFPIVFKINVLILGFIFLNKIIDAVSFCLHKKQISIQTLVKEILVKFINRKIELQFCDYLIFFSILLDLICFYKGFNLIEIAKINLIIILSDITIKILTLMGETKKKPYNLYIILTLLFILCIIATRIRFHMLLFWLFTAIVTFGYLYPMVEDDVKEQLRQLDAIKQTIEDFNNPNRMYERLGVDILSIQIGQRLLDIADPEQDGQLIDYIGALRQRITDNLGYIIPNIRILDCSKLKDNEYEISVRGCVVANGIVYPDRVMVLKKDWDKLDEKLPDDVIISNEPTFQTQAYWFQAYDIKDINVKKLNIVDVIIQHLEECVIKYSDEIITKTDVIKLMELVKTQDFNLVNDLIPTLISTTDLKKILVNLIKEKVSIKDINFVFEKLNDYARFSKEPDILSEMIRISMSRKILAAICDENKNLKAIIINDELLNKLEKSIIKTPSTTKFSLNSDEIKEIINMAAQKINQVQNKFNFTPVILTNSKTRLPFYRLICNVLPNIVVISDLELSPEFNCEIIDI